MAFNARKVKTYAKLIGIGLLVLFVLIFMLSNRQSVKVQFLWWTIWNQPLFYLILVVANLGIMVFLVFRKIRKVINEVRQLREEDRARNKLVSEIKNEVANEKKTET